MKLTELIAEAKSIEQIDGIKDLFNYVDNPEDPRAWDNFDPDNGPIVIDAAKRGITTLGKKLPPVVNGPVKLYQNKLTSLEGLPRCITGDLNISYNRLTSLDHIGDVGGALWCEHNDIKDFTGLGEGHGPIAISANNCEITSFKGLSGLTTDFGTELEYINVEHNNIETLHNVHNDLKGTSVEVIRFTGNPISSSILGLTLVDGLRRVEFAQHGTTFAGAVRGNKAFSIIFTAINKPDMTPRERLLWAQSEMINAGLEEYAKL